MWHMYFWTKTCCKLENWILQFECFKWCWPTPLQYFYLHVAVVARLLQHICSLQNMQRTYWGFQMCQVELSANILNNGIQLHTATCKLYCAIRYDIVSYSYHGTYLLHKYGSEAWCKLIWMSYMACATSDIVFSSFAKIPIQRIFYNTMLVVIVL